MYSLAFFLFKNIQELDYQIKHNLVKLNVNVNKFKTFILSILSRISFSNSVHYTCWQRFSVKFPKPAIAP